MRLAVVLLLACAIPVLAADGDEPPRPLDARGRANLVALARLLGYVEHFHGSDQAAEAPWNAITVAAVRRVEDAPDAAELARRLEEVVSPWAPLVRVAPAGSELQVPSILLAPPPGSHGVAWHHLGYGRSELKSGVYESARVDDAAPDAGRTVELRLKLPASAHASRNVRLAFSCRIEGTASVWPFLRAEKDGGSLKFREERERAARGSAWTPCEVEMVLPPETETLVAGVKIRGPGSILFDDERLELYDGVEATPLPELLALDALARQLGRPPGFALPEAPDPRLRLKETDDGCRTPPCGLAVHGPPEPGTIPPLSDPLRTDLGGGVTALVPLTVPADSRGTLPRSRTPPAPILGPPGWKPSPADRATRIAGVIKAWNVLQHFYPYFDVVGDDWAARLPEGLAAAAEAPGEGAYVAALSRMTAALKDGHVWVGRKERRESLPIALDWVEGELAVVGVGDGVKDVSPGDVVRRVDGEEVGALRDRLAALVSSATEQWTAWTIHQRISDGAPGSSVRLDLEGPAGPRSVTVARRSMDRRPEPRPDTVAELEPGIWYLDIDRATASDVEKAIPKLVGARGVVLDLRGYPAHHGTTLLAHLAKETLPSPPFQVPLTSLPDRRDLAFQRSGWVIEPNAPRIAGKVVYLTDGRAISAAETHMGIVEAFHLGEIVGGATAGTNGNVATIALPCGTSISFTGMRVLKHDGSRLHGVGILPTVPVSRTLAGVRAGKDEVLAKALEMLRTEDAAAGAR